MSNSAQRLGKNSGGYFGERIDIQRVLRDYVEAAQKFGWQIERIPVSSGLELLAFVRQATAPVGAPSPFRLYLSTGIHGDEPAGLLAMRQLLRENHWPTNVDIRICPCLNPTGCALHRRENAEGIDLNRDYRHFRSAETRAHVDWLKRQPAFDLTLCLHEDWEAGGLYLYELNPDHRPSHSGKIIQEVANVCPIDPADRIEDRPAKGGIIRPDFDPRQRPEWPEAFYLVLNHTRHSYTLEAPSDFPLETRVAALATAVRVVLGGVSHPTKKFGL